MITVDPASSLSIPVANREAIEVGGFRFFGTEPDNRIILIPVDDGLTRMSFTPQCDRLAAEVDVFQVDAGGDQDEVPIHGHVDPLLDRGEIGWDVDRGSLGWVCAQSEDQEKGYAS